MITQAPDLELVKRQAQTLVGYTYSDAQCLCKISCDRTLSRLTATRRDTFYMFSRFDILGD